MPSFAQALEALVGRPVSPEEAREAKARIAALAEIVKTIADRAATKRDREDSKRRLHQKNAASTA